MTGRKKPAPNEGEKEHMYHQFERREKGEKIQGDMAEDLPYKGGAGEVRKQRDEWARKHGGKE